MSAVTTYAALTVGQIVSVAAVAGLGWWLGARLGHALCRLIGLTPRVVRAGTVPVQLGRRETLDDAAPGPFATGAS